MDKEVRNSIKKLLWLDQILSSSWSLSKTLEEAEQELEEMFGKSKKLPDFIEEFLNDKNLK